MSLYLNVGGCLVFLCFFLVFLFIECECEFLSCVCQENLLHLRKQHTLHYEFCCGCSIQAFAENKTIMTKPQTLSHRYVPSVCGTILTPLVSNHF